MNLPSAEKAIRHGAYAVVVGTVLENAVTVAAVVGDLEGAFAPYNNVFNLLSLPIGLLLAFGIWRRLRGAAVITTLLYLITPITSFQSDYFIWGLLVLPVFLFFVGRATYATFVYRRLRRREDPSYGQSSWKAKVLWGIGGVFASILIVLMLVGSYDLIIRNFGRDVGERALISGETGWYNLTVPGKNWVKMWPGSIMESLSSEDEADLEMLGPHIGSWVMVYAYCDKSWKLDDLVEYRFDQISEFMENVRVNEERRILPGTLTPVSFARYEAQFPIIGTRAVWWVATIMLPSGFIEALGHTEAGADAEKRVEEFIKSFKLQRDEDTVCDDS